jgi:hypothetical protein
MSGEKKVRADAVLKNLPEERQAEIFESLQTKSLAAVRKELREDGLQAGTRALSEFRSWYALRASLKEAESDTENLLELIKADAPELPEARLASIGNALFNLQAIKQQDPKLFLAFQTARHKAEMDRLKLDLGERKLAQQQESLELERQRFRRDTAKLFLEWCKDQRAREIAAGSESNAEKIERLGQLMFGEDWKADAP